ncbi:unnamed protein product [Calicophoron daubneyi]|uniref:Uncharacterized protein n=1 Tax=Calicophoron daubneyi TaxID=300641 RepID=A0AAV2TD57_CALDB
MSWFEKLYPPTYTVRDWEETVEKNPEYADYGINYWDLWMKFRRIGDGETASEKHVHRSIQTSPCIWNEKELEVLRECRLEMKKYVKALEDNAEDQKVKIEELQRKCIAQNALITRLLRKSNGTGETLRNRKDNETSTREETCDLTKNKLQLERDMYERRAELAEEKLLSFQVSNAQRILSKALVLKNILGMPNSALISVECVSNLCTILKTLINKTK